MMQLATQRRKTPRGRQPTRRYSRSAPAPSTFMNPVALGATARVPSVAAREVTFGCQPGATARSVASKSVLGIGPTHGALAPACW
jgi:hypothetical protein